jgi:hypothetical protein
MTYNLPARAAVLQRQIAWASHAGKQISRQGYLSSIDANLLQPLSASAREGFDNGGGSELMDTETRPAKIKALHSSAALAVNVFDYWAMRNPVPLAAAMGVSSAIRSIKFERQFPTGLGGNPPNLDVVLLLESGAVLAIESKFTEWMTARSPAKEAFRPAYFPQSEGVWARLGLVHCQQLAEAISDGREQFRWLDAPQLLKHALGLATAVPGRFSLHYMYFDAQGIEGTAHRDEIQRFFRAVGQEIGFQARSYQALVSDIVKHCGAEDANYLAYLQSRYFE